MDLTAAIKHAIDGNAILFLGSGASVGAKPLKGERFLTGRELAKYLSNLLALKPCSEDLNFVAQRFIQKLGERKLIEELQNLFTVSQTSELHRRLSEINWKGIYTTNYDNVIETAFAERKKKLTPVTLDDDPKEYAMGANVVLHINGYIDCLKSQSLDSGFKLTNTSYLTESFSKSNWSFVFRRHLEMAGAIFFIGYSMYDIDIQRILFAGDELRNKIVFVERNGLSKEEIDSSIQVDFGEVFPVGLKGFWQSYDLIAQSYVPQDLSDVFYAFEEKRIDYAHKELRDKDVFDLLLTGKVREDIVYESIVGRQSQPYLIIRKKIDYAIEAIKSDLKNIVATSDIANGKTLFCVSLAFKLIQQGYRLFWLKDYVDDTLEELTRIFHINEKVAIVIEGYTRRLDEVKYINIYRPNDLILIMSAKTSLHETYQEDLYEVIDPEDVVELNLNHLTYDEVESLNAILSTYKVWGEYDALSDKKKKEKIQRECESQLGSVLLDIVKSPAIKKKYGELFAAFQKKTNLVNVIVAASVLKLLGYDKPTEAVICELIDSNYFLSADLRRDLVTKEMLSFVDGGVLLRSSVLAKYGLTTFPDARSLVDILIMIATNAHNKGAVSDYYFDIYRDMVTYSTLQSMLPEQGKRESLIRFYEGIKNLRAAKNHPHFWLQYAIARLSHDREDDLKMAKFYIDSAYAHAGKRDNYHTKHLDSVNARYLIQHSFILKDIDEAMKELEESHSFIVKLCRTDKVAAPFRVARGYLRFYNLKRSSMSNEHLSSIKQKSEQVISYIDALPAHIKKNSNVACCKSELESVISDINKQL